MAKILTINYYEYEPATSKYSIGDRDIVLMFLGNNAVGSFSVQLSGDSPIRDLTNTVWIFNDTLNIEAILEACGTGSRPTTCSFDIKFSILQNLETLADALEIEGDLEYDSDYVMNYVNLASYAYNDGTWDSDFYKSIFIQGGTDTGNQDLILWLYANATLVESGGEYLTFSSPNTFTLSINDGTQTWDGLIEYSTDLQNWTEWDGSTTLNSTQSGATKYLYVRGSSNTYITGDGATVDNSWRLTGSNISCTGNIETLLDYNITKNNGHPLWTYFGFNLLFGGNSSLITAPELRSPFVSAYGYKDMFNDCTSLTIPPALPATTLNEGCYSYMFYNCTSLIALPELPATLLPEYCYQAMFGNCTSIGISTTQEVGIQVPYRIPSSGTGTDLVENATEDMFYLSGGEVSRPDINTTYYTSQVVPA